MVMRVALTIQYTCPVCAYSLMPYPAQEGNICPCCGTEFGYDDTMGVTFKDLLDQWVQNHAPWFSPVHAAPPLQWAVHVAASIVASPRPAPDDAVITRLAVSRLTGVPKNRLLRWIKRGLLPPLSIRTAPGGRGQQGVWPASVVERVKRILALQPETHGLDEIVAALADSPSEGV